jgi:hypothetical protein
LGSRGRRITSTKKLETSLDHIVRPCLKKRKRGKKKRKRGEEELHGLFDMFNSYSKHCQTGNRGISRKAGSGVPYLQSLHLRG